MLRIATEKQRHVIAYQDAKFTVEPLTKEEEKKLIDKHTLRVKKRPGPGQPQEFVEEIDFLELAAAKFDRQVVDWEGVDAECTTENKRSIVFLAENAHIYDHLRQEIDTIGQSEEERLREEEKN